MNPEAIETARKVLSNKLGRFYYKAKLGQIPKPEKLYVTVETDKGSTKIPSPELGTLSFFINWFNEEHGNNADLRFNKLINKIKKLCSSKDDTGEIKVNLQCCYKIASLILPLPLLIKSERYRKRLYQKLRKTEMQKLDRRKKALVEKRMNAKKTVKEVFPKFDEDQYDSLVKEEVENIKPSEALLQIQQCNKYGLTRAYAQVKKSTKGLETLNGFLYSVYSESRQHSDCTENSIYGGLAEILDLVRIRNTKDAKYTREAVRQLVTRHDAFLQNNPT